MKNKTNSNGRNRVRYPGILTVCAVLLAGSAWGVEPLNEAFRLWADDFTLSDRYVGFDIDPASAGVEVLVFRETEETLLPPDINNKVRGKVRFRFRALSEDGSTVVGDYPVAGMISFPFPDPGNALFQQGGANETFYRGGDDGFGFTVANGTPAADAREMVMENAGFPLGFGVAETSSGTVRTIIMGIGLGLGYSNNLDGETDASQYGWISIDPVTRTILCTVWLPGITADGFFLEADIAGVSNYLTASGRATEDEVRVLREREMPFQRRRAEFYDPRTCAHIVTNTENAPFL